MGTGDCEDGDWLCSGGAGLSAPTKNPCPPFQSDLGGKKILQRKWTSFMKARLVCYIPYYEVLRSVCSLDSGGWASTVFYAAFTLSAQW